MPFAATLHRDLRSTERHAVAIDGTFRDGEWQPLDVSVVDLSTDGFRARGPAGLAPSADITIGLPGLGVRRALVMRSEGGEYGCRFFERLTPAELSAAMAAVVAAPIPFPADARQRLLLQDRLPPVRRYSARVRMGVLAGGIIATWSALLLARLLA